MKKNLLSICDLSKQNVLEIFKIAENLNNIKRKYLKNKYFVLVFEKPSLRTRVTFELSIKQLGGDTVYLTQQDIQIGTRETISDIAKNLSLWCDGIILRVYSHKTLEEFAKYSTIPVVNALSDREHPCQAFADIFTILQYKKNKNINIAYIGDGNNNVCHSLILLASKLGINISVASPKNYIPDSEITDIATAQAKENKSSFRICNNPKDAVEKSDVIYTDVWVSMGQEQERDKRLKIFQPYQVNQKLLKYANSDTIVLHCLPAHRGEEITDDVISGLQSKVFQQAKNRLVLQKAILIWLFKK